MDIHRVLTLRFVNILKKMNVNYLLFISALFFVDVTSGCDHYIDCFTEFLQEFFANNATDCKNEKIGNVHKKYIELDEMNENLDKVINDLTVLIKDVGVNIKEAETKKEEKNKTQIHVKIFEFDNDSENYSATEDNFIGIDIQTTDGTTEGDFFETTTDSINFPELLLDHSITTSRSLDVIPLQSDKDNEIFNTVDLYDVYEDNSTDYPEIDYIELYKDTTNEDIEYIPTESPIDLGESIKQKEKDIENLIEESLKLINDDVLQNLVKNITNRTIESCNGDKMALSNAMFPWVAAIYLKNESNENQFEYFCDGALLSDRVVLTAARCVYNSSTLINPDNFIVILGKTSLQISSGEEKILKVDKVKPHEKFNYTKGVFTNDLALLILQSSVVFNGGIEAACLKNDYFTEDEEVVKEAVTTAWSLSGDLTLIYFDKEKSKACGSDNKVENTFCATYGNDVALCPSYGGLYVTISGDNHLFLQGLRTGNPRDRGICYSKDVTYTSLKNYTMWIQDNLDNK